MPNGIRPPAAGSASHTVTCLGFHSPTRACTSGTTHMAGAAGLRVPLRPGGSLSENQAPGRQVQQRRPEPVLA
jgi:hypothetical protein